jgi:hypothetical protein
VNAGGTTRFPSRVGFESHCEPAAGGAAVGQQSVSPSLSPRFF